MTVDPDQFPLLSRIDAPADLRALPESELLQVARELRGYLVHALSHGGCHFAANLGTVELAVALHYVYDTPRDRLVWDVGHQAYPHKILTGRRDRLSTIRQRGGLAPFPTRTESEYDTFGVGHSSTSISGALGMAISASLQDSENRAVAIIGDGAMTAGMAYEALNHAGALDADILVVFNDNDMSISPNVGALSNYLAKMLSGKLYANLREGSKKVLSLMPTVWELARRSEEHMKGMMLPGTLFEEFGMNYIGPVDGHDLPTLVATLKNVRKLRGAQFLHVVTRKGKGYPPAEADPVQWHAPGAFDPESGTLKPKAKGKTTYTQVFSEWVCDMAEADPRLVAITPAMREGSGLVEFEQRFPDRYFDVGIAEQHSVTLAAGFACEGSKPVVAIYSTFLQRAYDQLVHDVALQNLPVLFAIDRAGVVGPDGPTHAGSFDLTFLRCIPNLVIMAPADEAECRAMLTTGFRHDGPAAVRYPRGSGPGATVPATLEVIPIGSAETRRRGRRIALLAFGSVVAAAAEAAETLDATLVNMRFVRPLDEATLATVIAEHELLVTIEDNAIAGGAGSAVNEWLARNGHTADIMNLGLPDRFLEHGSREQLLADAGIDAAGIVASIRKRGVL
ncbi:MAG: 1-deoxy-D-xylulose-5-phosphate synthase [Xanthomonadaceae bacterium]|nr:1-deoxy-D-xylulose-5-phosphate synthase [Xanthomonadaceae bacterium]